MSQTTLEGRTPYKNDQSQSLLQPENAIGNEDADMSVVLNFSAGNDEFEISRMEEFAHKRGRRTGIIASMVAHEISVDWPQRVPSPGVCRGSPVRRDSRSAPMAGNYSILSPARVPERGRRTLMTKVTQYE